MCSKVVKITKIHCAGELCTRREAAQRDSFLGGESGKACTVLFPGYDALGEEYMRTGLHVTTQKAHRSLCPSSPRKTEVEQVHQKSAKIENEKSLKTGQETMTGLVV